MSRHRELSVDACVIGSGAGGGPVAKELAEGGMRVAILEEGRAWRPEDFTARPRETMPRLYRDAGQIATVGTPPIVLPLGRAVGGTTLINSGTCFRTPDHVLDRWARELGLEELAPPALSPYFARVERELSVQTVPEHLAGPNALTVKRGAEALGLSGGFLRRNATGCVGSGVCAFGCPSGAKQHTGATYVPKAVAAGAQVIAGARATRIERVGGRATAVLARTAGGGSVRVRCDHVVVACGAIHTPLLLRRNGLGLASGELGRNLSIHPATAVRAVMPHPVGMADGVPQSYYVDELAGDGIMLEGIGGPPDQGAMATPGSGAEHRELMLAFGRTATFGAMVCDVSRGTVRERLGRPLIRYDLHAEDAARFHRGLRLLADIFWAAGAERVVAPVAGLPALRDGDSGPLRAARIRPRDLSLMAFHPLGTARAGADPARAVVDASGRVHGAANVYVADAAAVPTALGVNPQITIMALATRLAFGLLGRRAPAEGPVATRASA